MGLRKTVMRGVAVAAAGALPLWMSAQPASAFESHSEFDSIEHSFTDFGGDTVTCQIEFSSRLFRESSSDPYQGAAATMVLDDFNPERDSCEASVAVAIVYNLAGREQTARAFGTSYAELQLDEVDGNFFATHAVDFLNCFRNCRITYETSPK